MIYKIIFKNACFLIHLQLKAWLYNIIFICKCNGASTQKGHFAPFNGKLRKSYQLNKIKFIQKLLYSFTSKKFKMCIGCTLSNSSYNVLEYKIHREA